jgi:hypothetical protein
MPVDTEHTLSVPEAGKRYFGLSRNASYLAAINGDLPTVRIGKLYRVPIAAVERMLNEAGHRQSQNFKSVSKTLAALPAQRKKSASRKKMPPQGRAVAAERKTSCKVQLIHLLSLRKRHGSSRPTSGLPRVAA